ncbi:tRNA (guanosine(46)-N7)-methyltransferase TrmB [Mangrovactinospora gilvigrisea]|uniref:tRNA (guanine-N(7)-)-methyltransferase n=1 Tax=Mangrovactinospora gilvigrisea TaxID=1428644 RepID=A0A1J7BHG5_9ACTN|nr:tRNA (guanosine(46)-N7)-methyltransferase TrmB [Mangrovactinospora gilvigrisea]OIV38139.1 tRNA (guanosine(46)-N7)-methyltransferase TrmB [Mangrovactinospora gilvigrisea]
MSAHPPSPDAADPAHPHHRQVHSFHARSGRITQLQAGALRRLWPRYGVEIDGTPLDPAALLDGRPVVVEIGSGMGDATARMAADDPSTGLLAVEVHRPGLGSLLHRIEADGLANVRVAAGDAVVLLRDMLPEGSLAGLRIFFPDPWPKKRHHKRRLVQPEFVRLAASRLAPGGVLHCATDWEPYAEQMLAVLSAEPLLANTGGEGWSERPEWRPVTKFERQGMQKGHVIRDLLFARH